MGIPTEFSIKEFLFWIEYIMRYILFSSLQQKIPKKSVILSSVAYTKSLFTKDCDLI